jgi:hypothetical protein
MLEELLGGLTIPEPDPDRWREQLKELAHAQLHVLTEYPGIARVALETIVPTGPNALRLGEGFLAILRACRVRASLSRRRSVETGGRRPAATPILGAWRRLEG